MPGVTAASFYGLGAAVKAGVKEIMPDIPELPSLNIGGDKGAAVKSAAKATERDKLRSKRGVGANILTSPLGVVGQRMGSRLFG